MGLGGGRTQKTDLSCLLDQLVRFWPCKQRLKSGCFPLILAAGRSVWGAILQPPWAAPYMPASFLLPLPVCSQHPYLPSVHQGSRSSFSLSFRASSFPTKNSFFLQ